MILYHNKASADHTPGGKALGLYRLQDLGYSVPPFAVIPAETFDDCISHLANAANAEQAREALMAFSLTEEDRNALEHILSKWNFPENAVVVRSSVADEDGEQHAFAGMMDSYLNLTSMEDVVSTIALCAASAYSERAIAYRQQKGLTLQARPAVIIQQQIKAEVSGIMFTTFPEYPQELAIHALWGFGEGLVGGKDEADEFYFLKKEARLHRQQIVFKHNLLKAIGNRGLSTVALEEAQQHQPSLSPEQLQELFKVGTALEKALGRPQDLEFTLQKGQLYLLQARPITQPIPEPIVYDNSNIQESYCGVTTPLTFSFASRAYATVYRQTMHILGLPAAVIQEKEAVVSNLLGLVQGRIYYNINNWYKGLQLLPSFKQNKEDMERMMGVEEPVDFVENREKALREKIQLLPGLLLNLWRLWRKFKNLKSLVRQFQSHFNTEYNRFYQLSLPNLLASDLIAEKEQLDVSLLRNWTTPIINDFWVMMSNGSARRKLKKAGIEDPEEFLSRYLSGDPEIESAQPTHALIALAGKALLNPSLRARILEAPEDLHQQIWQDFPDFHKEVTHFIAQYGDRTVGELKLETMTMRIEPLIFYKYLRNYLHADSRLPQPGNHSRLATEARHELEIALKRSNSFFRKKCWKSLDSLQQAIRNRESMRLERTRLFGMYRTLYLAMGDRLVQAEQLENQSDVFYLTEVEMIEALHQPRPFLASLVAGRKHEFACYRQVEVPSRVVVPSPPTEAAEQETESPGRLKGSGCYPGEISGEVIVIRDPSDALDVRNKIVCALRTDPGWAALFPACRAVLIEKGSSLSHSVILLRELGIPTIINIPGLTSKLASGDWVSINGSSGYITKLDHAQA